MAGVRSIAGMRDFFGKKLGDFVYQNLAHMSPIDLMAGETATKIGTAARAGMMSGGAEIFNTVKNAIKNRGDYKIGDWFQGFNIGENRETLSAAVKRNRMLLRVGVPAAVGAAGLSSVVSPGNPLDVTARAGLQMGMVATTAGVIGRHSPGIAAAYAAWGGVNMLRPGDNMGPF